MELSHLQFVAYFATITFVSSIVFYSYLLLTIFSVKEGSVHFGKRSFFVRVCISMGLNGS